MAFQQPSGRRQGFGQGGVAQSGGRGVGQPASTSYAAGGQSSRADSRPRSVWSTAAVFYDDYHSALSVDIVAEFFSGAKFAIKLSPVFGDRRGPSDGGTGKKYNYDDSAVLVLDLGECILFREQLAAFISGQLTETTMSRESKRLVLARSESYYDPNHPEYEFHKEGLVVSVEQDATDKQDAKTIVFIGRPVYVQIQDGADNVIFYPEIQALQAVLESYLSNIARVDFASVRLLEGSRGGEDRPSAPSAPQPTRRTGGLSASPAAASSAPSPAAGTMRAAAPRAGTSATVTDADIGAALGGGGDGDALDAALDSAPKF
jgi:hypothetical protein